MYSKVAAETRVSNTGSVSQTGFSVGLDWLTYTHNQLHTGNEVQEIISAIESLAGDQIDFSPSRPRYDNHKHWAGSGLSKKGLQLWYNPPRTGDELLIKSLDGNLASHPGLLPAGHCPVTDAAAEYIRSRLPDHAQLRYESEPVKVYDPNDGSEHIHHGYSIVSSDEGAIAKPGELRVSMTGSYMNHVNMSELAAYLLWVKDIYGLRCSRVDVALDDHDKRVPLSLVEQARCDRNYFNVRITSVVKSDEVDGNIQGQTVYFGSRQSAAFLRVYDKTAESKGKCIGNRWEVEFHGKKADACVDGWLSAMAVDESKASRLLKDLVLGTIDFRDRSKGDKNRKRCPVLPWFQSMCDLLDSVPLRLRVARPIQTMQKTFDFLKKSVAQSLASVKMVIGNGFEAYVNELVDSGMERMNNVRRKVTEDADISQLCY